MKNISLKYLSVFLFATLLLNGCKKEENDKSKATFWPTIEMIGDEYVVLEYGVDTYTEQGVIAKVNGVEVPYTTVSDVDDTETGAYTVVYAAKNEDGIAASIERRVIVVNPAAAADDLSGTYQRGTGTPMTVWTKDPDRAFRYNANNPGGVGSNPPFNAPFFVFNVEPGVFVMPLQQAGQLAPFYATSGSVGGDPKIGFNVNGGIGQVAYAYYMNGASFVPALRTFIKR